MKPQRRLQAFDGGSHSAAPSPKIRLEAWNLYRAGRTVGQVARFIGLEYNVTADAIFEHQQWREAHCQNAGVQSREAVAVDGAAVGGCAEGGMSGDYLSMARELYPQRDGCYWCAPCDYTPIIDKLGTVLVRHDDDDYQGDTFALVRNDAGLLGLVDIGWGSCSGCDALQGCDSDAEVAKLIEDIHTGVEWKTLDDMRAYFQTHDWEGGYGWQSGCQQAFVDEARKVLESL